MDWVKRAHKEAVLRAQAGATPTQILVDWVIDFHTKNRRIPTYGDLKAGHRNGTAPSPGLFTNRGGLPWIIERAGLEVKNKATDWEPVRVRIMFREGVNKFREANQRWPTRAEYERNSLGTYPSITCLKNQLRKTYKELLEEMGKPLRRSKLANLPYSPHK